MFELNAPRNDSLKSREVRIQCTNTVDVTKKTNVFVFKPIRRLRPVRYRSHRTPRQQVWNCRIVITVSLNIVDESAVLN